MRLAIALLAATAALAQYTPPSGGGGSCGSPNCTVSGDLTVDGSATISTTVAKSGTLAAPVAAPTVTQAGTPGVVAYGYTIAWYDQTRISQGGPERVTTTGNATLDDTNYNVINAGTCPAGVLGFIAYRSTGAGSFAMGSLGSATCGNTISDQGVRGNNAFAPTNNFVAIDGLVVKRLVIGDDIGTGVAIVNDDGMAVRNPDGTQGVLAVGRLIYNPFVAPMNPDLSGTTDRGEFAYVCDATAGTVSLALPSAVGSYDPANGGVSLAYPGQMYLIKKTDASANACRFVSANSETFDGAAGPLELTVQNEMYWIESDGDTVTGNWKIIGHYVPGVPTVSAASTGKAICWKTATTLGYCSDAPDMTGACTCN